MPHLRGRYRALTEIWAGREGDDAIAPDVRNSTRSGARTTPAGGTGRRLRTGRARVASSEAEAGTKRRRSGGPGLEPARPRWRLRCRKPSMRGDWPDGGAGAVAERAVPGGSRAAASALAMAHRAKEASTSNRDRVPGVPMLIDIKVATHA